MAGRDREWGNLGVRMHNMKEDGENKNSAGTVSVQVDLQMVNRLSFSRVYETEDAN